MKRKWLALGIILLFVGTCIIPAIAQDAEKPLPTSRGNWLYVGGSGPGNYTRIQDAIDNASNGDTIFVFSGLYIENVYINKSITLLGENRDYTIIDANGNGSPILSLSSNVTISSFTVQNSEGENVHGGIVINHYPYNFDCSNNRISGNKIINNNFGVHISSSSNSSIINNLITLNRRGGVFFNSCVSSKVENNIITKNDVAQMTDDAGVQISTSYQITIRKNRIEGNAQSLYLYHANYCDISENSLSNNSVRGIYLLGDNIRFYSNNFINNTKDVYFSHRIFLLPNRNHFINNYWDNYGGIGPQAIAGECFLYIPTLVSSFIYTIIEGYPTDHPIFIKWLYFDWRPVLRPYDIPGMR